MPAVRRLVGVTLLAMAGLAVTAPPARAEVGLGLFVGQPTGLDVKLDLARRSALDLVLGWDDFDDGRDEYAHLTYLVNLGVVRGRSVLVPFRLGVGAAVYGGAGGFGDEVNLAVRAPFEIGLRMRRAPLEIYFEVALKLTLLDDNDNDDQVDADGGIGLRIYL